MNWDDWYKALLALVTWREARGETWVGKRAVAHVIRNRVLATHLPDRWDDIISAPWQFSSMTAPGDPMLVKWPNSPDSAFAESMNAAELVYGGDDPDPTGGATLYCNLKVCMPLWSKKATRTVVIGRHTFFKE